MGLGEDIKNRSVDGLRLGKSVIALSALFLACLFSSEMNPSKREASVPQALEGSERGTEVTLVLESDQPNFEGGKTLSY